MSSGLLSIGASALDAAYTALRTTGNNIANVNTPGYSRQLASFTTQIEPGIGGMYLGNGVSVQDVSRVYSSFLGQQTNLTQAISSAADTTATLTGQVNSLFANTSTSLGAATDSFFSSIQSLNNLPGSAANRQVVLSSAQQMSAQFNDFAAQLNQMSTSADQQMGQEIATVNTTLGQIASLNDQIALATASGGSPNSLLDQRDSAIQTLNKSIGVTTNTSAGAINVYLANGQPLVVGDKTYALTMGADPTNAQSIVVGTSNGTAIAALDPTNSGGGAIGALLQFRTQTLPSIENQVGRLAVVMASKINAVQNQGRDLNGNAGANIFTTPAISTSSASTNTDAGTVSISGSYSDVTQLQASDYQLSVQGSNYTLTRLSDNTIRTGTLASLSSAPIDGMTLTLSGTPANGDIFNISPVRYGAQDLGVSITQGAQIAAASPLQATLGASNAGSLAVSNLALQPLPAGLNANINSTVSINFTSPTQYTTTTGGVTSAAQTYTAGTPINVNGWTLTLNGTPANGDSVLVSPSGSGSGDNRNSLLMSQLQQQLLVNGATLDNAYATVVGNVGSLAATAKTDQTSKNAIFQNATAAESSVSGVNLDEEAARLMQFQQQYQAAAKMIQTADTVFNSILQVAGGA